MKSNSREGEVRRHRAEEPDQDPGQSAGLAQRDVGGGAGRPVQPGAPLPAGSSACCPPAATCRRSPTRPRCARCSIPSLIPGVPDTVQSPLGTISAPRSRRPVAAVLSKISVTKLLGELGLPTDLSGGALGQAIGGLVGPPACYRRTRRRSLAAIITVRLMMRTSRRVRLAAAVAARGGQPQRLRVQRAVWHAAPGRGGRRRPPVLVDDLLHQRARPRPAIGR